MDTRFPSDRGFFPYPRVGDVPVAYTQPFVPRYSVPEGFQRALSYEGQLHWLAQLCNDAYAYLEAGNATWVAASQYGYTAARLDSMVGTDQEFSILEASPADEHTDLPGCVKAGDVVMLRVNDSTNKAWALVVGYLVSACRCNAPTPDKWVLHVLHVVHDYENRVKALEDKVADHETRITSLESRMTKAETNITNLDGRVTKAETNITNLTTRMGNVENRLTNVENNITKMGDNLTAVKKTLADIVSKVYGGGTIDPDTGAVTWNRTGTIPLGNLNVYGQAVDPASNQATYIKTHDAVSDNDLWFRTATS